MPVVPELPLSLPQLQEADPFIPEAEEGAAKDPEPEDPAGD